MMQYSVYIRHCASIENAKVHVGRIARCVPSAGEVRFLTITDKQFGRIETYVGKKTRKAPPPPPAPVRVFLSLKWAKTLSLSGSYKQSTSETWLGVANRGRGRNPQPWEGPPTEANLA